MSGLGGDRFLRGVLGRGGRDNAWGASPHISPAEVWCRRMIAISATTPRTLSCSRASVEVEAPPNQDTRGLEYLPFQSPIAVSYTPARTPFPVPVPVPIRTCTPICIRTPILPIPPRLPFPYPRNLMGMAPTDAPAHPLLPRHYGCLHRSTPQPSTPALGVVRRRWR